MKTDQEKLTSGSTSSSLSSLKVRN